MTSPPPTMSGMLDSTGLLAPSFATMEAFVFVGRRENVGGCESGPAHSFDSSENSMNASSQRCRQHYAPTGS